MCTQIFVGIQKGWYLNICWYSKLSIFIMWLLKIVGTLKKLWVCKIVGMQNRSYLKFAGTQNVVSTQNFVCKESYILINLCVLKFVGTQNLWVLNLICESLICGYSPVGI